MAKANLFQSGSVVDKINEDLAECITILKSQWEDENFPISDDNLTLQKFCAKLEFLLQHNIKDKTSVLGTKKGYWDYFCHCLASSRKQVHDGIRFVKQKSELKSAQGKGRAFIRFCLSHGCLADSLQRCFSQLELTKEWYFENAIPSDSDKWSALISALYDLNDIHFDLSPECHDLDISWPTFSRKQYDSGRFSWKPPSRSVSISSFTSQSDSSAFTSFYESVSDGGNLSKEQDHIKDEDDTIYELQQSNIQLQKREVELMKELAELKKPILNGVDRGEEYATKTELLSLQHASREQYFAEAERVAANKISLLENQKKELRVMLANVQLNFSSLQETVSDKNANIASLDETIQKLKTENSEFSAKLQISVDLNSVTNQNLQELNEKTLRLDTELKDAELKLKEALENGDKLALEYKDAQLLHDQLKESNAEVCDMNQVLLSEVSKLKEELECAQRKNSDYFERTETLESTIKSKVAEMESKTAEIESQRTNNRILEEKIEVLVAQNSDSQATTELLNRIGDLEALNSRLRDDIKVLAHSLQTQMEEVQKEKCGLAVLVDKLEHSKVALEEEISQKNTLITESDAKLQIFDQYGVFLTPLISQQDTMLNHFDQSIDILLGASHKLKLEMQALTVILQRLAKYSKSEMEFPSLAYSKAFKEHRKIDQNVAQDDSSSSYENYPLANLSFLALGKLRDLLAKKDTVESIVSVCQALCIDMTAFAVEKEDKLMSKRIKLQHTQQVVETLAKEHKKVQAAEAILKYELKEKRKLLTKLRVQLESTREDWNRVKRQNAESETEWRSLREDFAKRYKQPSEESGFVDDKIPDESNTVVPNEENTNFDVASTSSVLQPVLEDVPISVSESVEHTLPTCLDEPQSPSCSSASQMSLTPCDEPQAEPTVDLTELKPEPEPGVRPRRRLEILEEQCNLLYFSLLHSSKKSELLEQRLTIILGPNSEDNSLSSEDSGAGSTATGGEPVEASDAAEATNNITADAELYLPVETELSNPEVVVSEEENSESMVLNSSSIATDNPDGNFSAAMQWESNSDNTSSDALEDQEEEDDNNDRLSDIEETELSAQDEVDRECASVEMNATRKKALESFVSKLKNERTDRDCKESEMKYKIEALEIENSRLEMKVMQLQKENASVSLKSSDFRKRAEFIFRKERDSFDAKLQAAATERLELQTTMAKLQEQLRVKEEQLGIIQSSLEQIQREKKETETTLSQEISSLRFQVSTEALKYERSLKNYSGQESGIIEMREKINHQEQIILSLEDSLSEIREEREKEKEKQALEFDDLQISLSTRDEECISMNEELKRMTKDLDETKRYSVEVESQCHNVEKHYKNKIEQLASEIFELRNDNEELKSQVIKLTRDKDSLWKKSEHLSRMHPSPTGDRWLADNEVTDCLSCKSVFSFTLRKHHCRLCGRIFCHNCAGHWVLTTSSSRRSRVCDECFLQHADNTLIWKEPLRQVHEEEATEVTVDDSISVDSMPVFNNNNSNNYPPSLNSSHTPSEGDDDDSNTDTPKDDNDVSSQSANEAASGLDFDVISDEEIARSLSGCSPYSPAPDMQQSIDNGIHCSETRSVKDIEEAGPDGLKGEIWINAGTTYNLPIIVDMQGTSISWEFTSEPKSIAFSVAYKEGKNEQESYDILLNTTRVQSHLRPVQGHLVAKHSGVYLLVFDNHFSRFMAKKVSYCLKIVSSI